MPVINKLPRKPKSTYHSDTDMRKLRQTAYQSTAWKKLRVAHLKEHPLCEECLRKGKVTAADSVHHIRTPFRGGSINYDLLLNPDNLESICRECHAEIHNKEKGHLTAADIIKQLDDLFNENISDEEIEGNDN